MRILLAIAVTSLIAPIYVQTASNDSGLGCFENLAAPEYPKAAMQAGVEGSVWITAQVSPQGAIQKLEPNVVSAYSEGAKMLTPPVEKAVRAAKVRPACNGKTMTVVFRYALYGSATPNPKVTTRIEGGNVMWIESQPAPKR